MSFPGSRYIWDSTTKGSDNYPDTGGRNEATHPKGHSKLRRPEKGCFFVSGALIHSAEKIANLQCATWHFRPTPVRRATRMTAVKQPHATCGKLPLTSPNRKQGVHPYDWRHSSGFVTTFCRLTGS